jgi:hypothetical protein
LKARLHPAQRYGVRLARLLCLVLAVWLTGCRHKTVRAALPIVLLPVDLDDSEPLDPGPMIAEIAPPEFGLPEPPAPPKPAPRRRPAPTKEEPPVQVASGGAALAMGDLTSGNETMPQSQQQARDLIASILKRIGALPAKTINAEKKELRDVHRFVEQAQQALTSGDPDGAINLATKARVLMDDLEKK